MLHTALKFVNRQILHRLGYDVTPVSRTWHVHWLRRQGFTPRSVVDVGVGQGTDALYQAYPNAYHVLIDPLVEFEPAMQRVLRHYQGAYFLTAVGAHEEQRVIHIHPGSGEGSSLHMRTALERPADPTTDRLIPVTTLDVLLARHAWQPPFGLKLDCEGHELAVLQGARHFLQQTQFVIAEVMDAVFRRKMEGQVS